MTRRFFKYSHWLVLFAWVAAACQPAAAPPVNPPATSVQGTGSETQPTAAPSAESPVEITGVFTYSNDIITIYYVEQAVALVDMYGFVTRDLEWEIPIESQTLGYLKLDPAKKEGTYWLQLPARPAGTLADVDNNGSADTGVQIFAVSYWPNLTGGPFSEGDDPSRGWPNYLASVKTDTENKDEVIGGQLVVWAPDDQQQFPTGYGADNLLFTADDPVGPIPAGYSIVDLDQDPFAVSQAAKPQLELYEPQDVAIKDYSAMSYTEAFENLYQKASTEWAFNGVPGKEVDWPALHDRIAPLVAEAEQTKDGLAFYRAIHAFTLAIPDGHTGVGGGQLSQQDFVEQTSGGYGFAIHELEDGRFIVIYVMPGGPAAAAGMEVGAEVTGFNGESISDAVSKVEPYAGPFSMESSRRYQQARYLLRGKEGDEATITFSNPGGKSQTVKLTAIAERESFVVTSIHRGEDSNALPVESRILDSGIGYIKINSNYDDLGLIIRLFERALKVFKANEVAGLIIDLRHNSGGAPLGLAGFLYDKEIVMGQLEYYSDETGKFEPEGLPDKVLPNVEQYRFDKIALLVGQACASACELEAYGFSKVPGAIVVGMYPSAGVEAEVARGQFVLPEGLGLQIPTGRFVNPDGSIFLEGMGVVPTVKVPINEANVLAATDVELTAAEDAIFGISPNDVRFDSGLILGAPESAQAALKAKTKFIEEFAEESYTSADLAKMDQTFPYTVTLDKDRRLLWFWGWCASTPEVLKQNYEHIQLEFSVNGEAVDISKFAVAEEEQSGLVCKTYYTVLFHWPSGETKLQTKVTFDTKINDGTADYAAGSQIFDYTVTMP